MPEPLRRHTLVWLPPDAMQAVSPAQAVRLRAWCAQGHPMIVARRPPGTPGDPVHLGVPLPPAEGKQRLAARAAASAVVRTAPLPPLAQVIDAAPRALQPALASLRARAEALGCTPRVFGAFAWQTLTGLDYVHAASDLDLLWDIDQPERIEALVALLANWEQGSGQRVDGELRLRDGRAMSWRELASGAPRVLVKTDDDARLEPRLDLFDIRQVAA